MADELITTSATPDAGAVTPESTPAAVSGVTETVAPDAGAVTPESTPAAVSGGEVVDTTGQEGVTTPTEGQYKKTLDERVAELTGKQVDPLKSQIAALETKLQAVTATQQLDFIPDLDFAKVNDYFRDTMAAIEQAQLDGDYAKALDLQDELANTRKAIKDNEAKKADYMQRAEAQKMSEEQNAAINQQIEQASSLVAKEYGIPPEVWKQGEEFFMAERRAKPLIDAQYREKVLLQGPVAALLWAKEYVEQNMGKKEEALINQIETAKETLPPGKTAVGAVDDAGAAKLAALKQAASSGRPEDIAAYSKALRESRQTTP